MKGAYTPAFTPLARPGDLLALDAPDTGKQMYEIDRMVPLPEIQMETQTVNTGVTDTDVELTNLEIWNGWLAQYRMPRFSEELPTDVQVRFDQGGRQAPLFSTKNVRGSLREQSLANVASDAGSNQWDTEDISHLAEFYVLEDEVPLITIENNTAGQIDIQLSFAGFAFEVSETSSQQGRTPIYAPVESIRGG